MKLSTKQIKVLISTWLNTPELKNELHSYYVDDDDQFRHINDVRRSFDVPSDLARDEVREHIWKLWIDGSQWARQEKRRLKDEWEGYLGPEFFNSTTETDFPIDFAGDVNQVLARKYGENEQEARRCWFRMFVPKSSLGDNFRLEVVTTPDDAEVIGWTVMVD